MRLPLLLVAFVVAASPTWAQATNADAAALALEPALDAPGLVAATAALIHETTGRYPATPFELLGSAEAEQTGLRRVVLTDLALEPAGDSLAVRFGLTPPTFDPTDRRAMLVLAPGDTLGQYDARFRLERTDDRDFTGRPLPFTEEGGLRVEAVRGRLCVDTERVRTLLAAGLLDTDTPFFGSARGLTVRFATLPARRAVGEARLAPPR